MNFLLDTHVWLWMQTDLSKFKSETLEILRDTENTLLLSAASTWEMAIKYRLGKLPLPVEPVEYVPSRMVQSGTTGLAIEHRHAAYVSQLPLHHRDPFDRLLVSQARLEGLTLLTADVQMKLYDVETLSP